MWKPYEAQKAVYETLKSSSSLLPADGAANQTFKNFEDLANTIEGYVSCGLELLVGLNYISTHDCCCCCCCCCCCSLQQELSEVTEDVGQWWGGCEETSQWLGETEGNLVAHKPLASSLDIVEKQRQGVQV